MRKLPTRMRLLLPTCLALGIMLVPSGRAYAQWYWTHGNCAYVQDEFVIDRPSHYGWGLDFVQNGGLSNWVHFAIPSVGSGENGVSLISLKFLTGSDDAWVHQIDVYDGDNMFQSIQGHWTGYNDIELDLGQNWQLWRGLGISVGIATGVEGMSHRFTFVSAGGYLSPF